MPKLLFSLLLVITLNASPPQSDKGRFTVFASSDKMIGVRTYFAVPYAKAPRCIVYGDHSVISDVENNYVEILTPIGAKVEYLCEERK